MKKAIYKVPNGKLLKIFLEEDAGKIKSVKITGDFFVHPEENIEKLETALAGSPLSTDPLNKAINDFFESNPTALFGIDIDSIVSTILNAK